METRELWRVGYKHKGYSVLGETWQWWEGQGRRG